MPSTFNMLLLINLATMCNLFFFKVLLSNVKYIFIKTTLINYLLILSQFPLISIILLFVFADILDFIEKDFLIKSKKTSSKPLSFPIFDIFIANTPLL